MWPVHVTCVTTWFLNRNRNPSLVVSDSRARNWILSRLKTLEAHWRSFETELRAPYDTGLCDAFWASLNFWVLGCTVLVRVWVWPSSLFAWLLRHAGERQMYRYSPELEYNYWKVIILILDLDCTGHLFFGRNLPTVLRYHPIHLYLVENLWPLDAWRSLTSRQGEPPKGQKSDDHYFVLGKKARISKLNLRLVSTTNSTFRKIISDLTKYSQWLHLEAKTQALGSIPRPTVSGSQFHQDEIENRSLLWDPLEPNSTRHLSSSSHCLQSLLPLRAGCTITASGL